MTHTPTATSTTELREQYGKYAFYDEGWNARCANQPYTTAASRHWKDGWKDADSVSESERVSMK